MLIFYIADDYFQLDFPRKSLRFGINFFVDCHDNKLKLLFSAMTFQFLKSVELCNSPVATQDLMQAMLNLNVSFLSTLRRRMMRHRLEMTWMNGCRYYS